MKLYRPVGLKELELILANNAYPPRLEWQPIFYPVLNFEYARQIATRWNLDDELSGYAGFVTEFDIDDAYVSQFQVQNVGGELHNELWVPAEELANFNTHIQGHIQLSAAFYGEKYKGVIAESQWLEGMEVQEQFTFLENMLTQEGALKNLIQNEPIPIQINISYWQNKGFNQTVLSALRKVWVQIFPEIRLLTSD